MSRGGNPILVVMGRDPCSEVRGLETNNNIDGYYSHKSVVMFVWNRLKIIKRDRGWPYYKHKCVTNMHQNAALIYNAISYGREFLILVPGRFGLHENRDHGKNEKCDHNLGHFEPTDVVCFSRMLQVEECLMTGFRCFLYPPTSWSLSYSVRCS